ncbi:MAG: hypothetical protein IJ766_10860 [Clostridia bacterium]|nr:hypothetical protein [Clostridia bacterium]
MPRKKSETHLWFAQGDNTIQVESFDKKLNDLIRKLKADVPNAVCVYADGDDGALRCEVKRANLSFRMIRPMSDKCRQAHSENGKRHADNLKHSKTQRG